MNAFASRLAFLVAFGVATLAHGAERTIRLSVPGMTCASCPYIIEKTISSVPGVSSVSAQLKDRSAMVTFDDAVTSVEAIRQATVAVGYESGLVDGDEDS